MPELPDIAAYITALEPRVMGLPLEGVRLVSPFLLRTTTPALSEAAGRTVRELRRVGKRIAIGLDGDLWLVLHLMIAGRLHWKPAHAALRGRQNLAAFDFPPGSLTLTEAGSKRRASLHVVAGEPGLLAMDPGGIDVLTADLACFRAALIRESQTLKRALTDPRIVSGVGNAYSDEILHAARLSPLALTRKLTDDEWDRLFAATRGTLELWLGRAVPGEGHGVSRGHGGSRALRRTVPAVRREDSPHTLCGQRNELLRELPGRRPGARRSRPFPAPGRRLAAHAR
jgi:formamidopyrimidine-DNA glycosylase